VRVSSRHEHAHRPSLTTDDHVDALHLDPLHDGSHGSLEFSETDLDHRHEKENPACDALAPSTRGLREAPLENELQGCLTNV
jgi:hypothetical protein